ncbi:MAG: hypothetical protein Phog2KO_34200 [Phototrophicaceae bacterium]
MREINPPQQSNQAGYTWVSASLLFIQTPSIDTLKKILKEGQFTAQKAYLWVFFGSILLGVALASDNPANVLILSMLMGLPIAEIDLASYQPTMLSIALMGIITGGIYGLIGFIIQTWTLQRIAQYFGTDGTFRDMFILRGLYVPILMTARALIISILGISSPVANTLIFTTLFLDMLLSTMALSAVNDLPIRRSMMVSSGMYLAMFMSLIILFALIGAIA